MAKTSPRPIGEVSSLVGVPLLADVELPAGESLAAYEIELVPGRKGGRTKAWADPTWQVRSDRPRVLQVDDHPAFEGMSVGRRRPKVRIGSSEPFDAYAWRLEQDGEPIESEMKVTDGLEPDGLGAGFRPSRRLRRSGRTGRPRRKDVFYPPFDSHLPDLPRSEASRIAYTALTHRGHRDEDAYAVDFNWRSGEADRGHWVRAAAAGVVSHIDRANGEVHISHPAFVGESDMGTVYAHLDPILVRKGQRVRPYQRIGRIGSKYYGDETISPHLHHQHRKDGQPTRMHLLVEGEDAPLTASRREPGRTIVQRRVVPGWERPRGPAPARLAVRTRSVADGRWSPWSELGFVVTAKDAPTIGEYDASFSAPSRRAPIDARYTGPVLEPGDYTARYRARGDGGTTTPWAYDRSIKVEPVLA